MLNIQFIYLIFTMLMLGYGAYLVYVRYNPQLRKKLLSKHKKGSAEYEKYQRLYSGQFLLSWLLITTTAVIYVAYNAYKASHTPSPLVLLIVSFGILILSAINLNILYKLIKKK